MLQDFINPGDKVEMQASGNTWMEEGGEDRDKTYVSKITDITSEDHIEVLMPLDKGKVQLLPVNGEFTMAFFNNRGQYQCLGRIVDRYRTNNMYLLSVDLISSLQKLQRRQYYRFNCTLKLWTRPLTEYEKNALRDDPTYEISQSQPMEESIIVDLSGGGLRFVSAFPYEENDLILCRYIVPESGGEKTFTMISRVLMVAENEKREGLFEHRIKYVQIDRRDREEIIHFIFEEERRLRRKSEQKI